MEGSRPADSANRVSAFRPGLAVADVDVDGEYHFERWKVGTSPGQLRALAAWLLEREVEEVVMESTAQYWRPGHGRWLTS